MNHRPNNHRGQPSEEDDRLAVYSHSMLPVAVLYTAAAAKNGNSNSSTYFKAPSRRNSFLHRLSPLTVALSLSTLCCPLSDNTHSTGTLCFSSFHSLPIVYWSANFPSAAAAAAEASTQSLFPFLSVPHTHTKANDLHSLIV